jgi:hypothetical protein
MNKAAIRRMCYVQLFQKRGWLPALYLFAFSGVVQAALITVTPTVTPDGLLYEYDYSVINNSGDDLEVLDIAVTPGSAILNLKAAPGFDDAYDSILGLVSFLENTSVFGPTAISGFTFDSSLAPSATTFNGTLLDANFNVLTIGGPTTGPVAPEPGYLPLLVFGVPLFLYRKRRSGKAIQSVNPASGGL